MEKIELIQKLNEILLEEMPHYQQSAEQFTRDISSQRQLLRSLMNVRTPLPLCKDYVALQDQLLSYEREEKGVVNVSSLPTTADPHIILWRGDITRINAEGIVNAANNTLLGCFHPCYSCIDNAIHSAAGLQLREECSRIMKKQGYEEPTGQAKITAAYNLPSKYVIHTVGPIIIGRLEQRDCEQLASCYQSCLEMAERNKVKSIAFCCISTGEYRFPADKAAEIAIHTVQEYLSNSKSEIKVIFNVFKESDETFYRRILGAN